MNAKIKIILDFNKEYWFVKNKYKDAQNNIGEKRFAYIVNCNILGIYSRKNNVFYKNLIKYIKTNKKSINLEIRQKTKEIKKKLAKKEKKFLDQAEKITGIKWHYKTYKIYPLFSCFWGGDYDIGKPNIYINPLLKHGDPLYIIFHELSHLIYWQYINSKYSQKLIEKNHNLLWKLSEVMVNYPLLKMKIGFKMPLIIPKGLMKFGKKILGKFETHSYTEIIDEVIKKKAE